MEDRMIFCLKAAYRSYAGGANVAMKKMLDFRSKYDALTGPYLPRFCVEKLTNTPRGYFPKLT